MLRSTKALLRRPLTFLAFTALLMASSLHAQNVVVTGAVAGNGTYADLGSAFVAINGAAQTGASIMVSIVGNTTEPVTASLNQGTWANLVIMPSGGAARTIAGSIVGPLVEFNGADRVLIDGLNVGGNSLSFDNANTGAASTIRFVNDARVIGVQNTTILGASTSATMGTVFYDLGNGLTGGNDSIALSACVVTNSGANFPINAIYSQGSTTAGQENGQNQILGCQISNFFSPGSLTGGVFLNTGNTDWTISNSRFFQTAARTYTTGNIHRVIRIASGNNHVVSGNIIGFATAGGTGTYQMGGANTTRLIAIDLAVGTTTASSVQGNTITAISLGTSSGAATTNGVLCGINVTAGSANIGTVAGNIIGGASGTNLLVATPTTTQGAVVGIHSSSPGAIAISNNVMGGFTSQGATASVAGTVTGINVSAAPSALSITNNVIGNTTANNMIAGVLGTTTGSSLASGISLSGTLTPAVTVTGNTVQNLSSYGTGTGGYARGIWTGTAGAGAINISNNTVANILTNNANASFTNGQLGAMGIYLGTGTGSFITNNTVTNVSNLNSGAVSTNVAGISHAVSSNGTISNNRIYGINNASTATSTTLPGFACGVFVRGAANNLTIFNNMISLGIGQTSNTSFVGVAIYGGGGAPTLTQVLHNTIYIGGTATSGAQPTMCVFRGNYSGTAITFPVDIRNNILENARTGGTGLHMAIANNYGATASATGWAANASNNNILNANPATVGYWTTARTFTDWQTASASDAASYTAATVTYVNNATDLHLNMGLTPNVIESNGQTIASVTTDIDGQTRPGPAGSVNGGATAPDLGADEFDGVIGDFSGPQITYSPLGVTCATGDRTLTATITDFTGVPTAGALQPRVYFRKNAGAWFSTQGTLSGGTGTNGTWTFNIVAATMGGLVSGDVVQYYVIAQDLVAPTPNIRSNPAAGLVATDVNTVTTAPTTPNSYPIGNVLSGTYTVGVAGNYPTLTAAVNAYNTNCIGGPIVFDLIDANYSTSETFPIQINQNPFASSVNTLTIKPATGNTATITGTPTTALIRVLGNHVTIDGSNSGGTTRDLTISNTGTTTPNVILIGSTGTTPVVNSTLKNTIIINGAQTSSAIVISDATTLGAAGYFNNITIQNNDVQRAFIGIFSIAAVATGNGSGTLITQNTLNTAGANSIRLVGIYAQGIDGITISSNTIGNIANTADAANVNGIFLATGTTNATITGNTIATMSGTASSPVAIRYATGVAAANTTISLNNISAITSSFGGSGAVSGIQITGGSGGITVTRNQITNIKSTNTGGWGANGIQLNSTLTAANILVSNNFVSDVAGHGFLTSAGVDDNGYGIVVNAGGGYNIYHNTVNMNTSQVVDGLPAAMNITGNVTTAGSIDLRNNIFNNTQTVGTNRYAIYSTATSAVFSNINHNDYFSTGPNLGFIGSARANIAAIQTGFGGNLQSVSIAPVFVSATDLHLVPASNTALNDIGTGIPAVTVDIDLDARSATTPDMGADEFTLPACTGTPTAGTATATPSSVCAGSPISLSVTGFTTGFTGITFQWQSSSTPGGPYTNIPGATTSTYNFTTAPAGVHYIVCQVSCTPSSQSALTPEITVTVTPAPVASVTPTTGQLCFPTTTPIALTASATGGTGAISYSWLPTTGLSAATGANVDALPFVNTTYTVTATDVNGCIGTASTVITVGTAVTIGTVTATPSTVCAGSTSALNVTATGGGSTNYAISSVPFAPISSGTGTVVLASAGTATTPLSSGTLDDGYWNGIAMPFPFNYFGTLYGTLNVGTNGYVAFSPITTNTGYGSTPQIPNTATPNNIVAGAFGDQEWRFGGVISTYTSGTAPNRIFVIDYNGTTGGGWYNSGSAPTVLVNYQIQLFENGNLIQVQTTNTPTSTQNHTMGIENAAGNAGFVVTGRDNGLWSASNDGTQFAPVPTYTYSWTPAAGLTPSSTVQNPTTGPLSGNTTFNVVVTEASGCTATGNVTVTVTPPALPTVTISANPGTSICAGTSVTFTAVPTDGGASPSYQWLKNSNPVGTNSTTYTDAGLVNGDVITCVMTSNASCVSPASVTSNALTIAVVTNTTPTVSITASPGTTICPGSSATFTASATNAGLTPSYQWRLNGNPVGTNSTTYTNGTLVTGDVITCVVTSSDACASPTTATSNAITMAVQDVTPPTITCPANISTNNTVGQCGAAVTYTAPVGADNCSGASTTQTAGLASGATFPVGTTTNTFTVTDGATLTASCSFTVTVTDVQAPSITCPANITVPATSGQCAAAVSFTAPVGTDNCPGASTAQSAGLASGASFPVGTTTNSFTVTAANSQTANCSFSVIVVDNEVPVINCPANITVNNTTGQCGAAVTFTAPVGTDNCSGATTAQSAGLASGATFPTGTTINTYTVTAANSQTASCSFNVTVVDAEAPAITCPANITVNNDAGQCAAVVNYTSPVGTDNCPGAITVQTAGLPSGSSYPVGTTTNTFAVSDISQVATCSFTVTVNDAEAPTAVCQPFTVTLDANGNGSLSASDLNNGSSDNCTASSGLTFSASSTSFTCANVGANNVTLTVTDGAGNNATCTSVVTVISPALNGSVSATANTCGYNVSCPGGNDGSATASTTGGCGSVSYLWSDAASQTTATATGLTAGTYSVTMTDQGGNVVVETIVLTEPAALVASTLSITGKCVGETTGAIDIDVAGGNDCSGYTYLWSNGATSEDISNLAGGNYSVTVTDAEGCSTTLNVVVPTFASPVVTIVNNGGVLSTTQPFSTYQWLLNGNPIPGETNPTVTTTLPGDYSVVVTDNNGCDGQSNIITGIEGSIPGLSFSLYPNPARGTCMLQAAAPVREGLRITIHDLHGRTYTERNLTEMSDAESFDLSGFAAGTYMVQVVTESGQRQMLKLVVQ